MVKAVFLSRKPTGIVLISLVYKYLKEKSSNETDENVKQEHGNTETYKMVNKVFLSRKPAGIVLIWLLYKYLKEKSSNETDQKEKQEHGNTKTYNSVKSMLFSNALAFTDVIPMFFKLILVPTSRLHVKSLLSTLSSPSHVQTPHSFGTAPTHQVNATTVRRKTRNFIVLIA